MAVHFSKSVLAALTIMAAAPSVTAAQFQAGDTFSDCENCPTMVVIPPGQFTMGSERGEFVLKFGNSGVLGVMEDQRRGDYVQQR